MNQPKRILISFALALFALSFAYDASAQSPADAKRSLKIGKELYAEPGLMEVKLQSMKTMIMLTGSVANEDLSKKAEKIAGEARGIKEVRNRIVIRDEEDLKPSDEEIMAKIEKAIADDEELERARRKLEIEVKDRNVKVSGKLKDYSQAGSLVSEIRRIRGVKTLNYADLDY